MTAIDSASSSPRRLFGGMPVSIAISLLWLVLVVLVAIFADLVAPADRKSVV